MISRFIINKYSYGGFTKKLYMLVFDREFILSIGAKHMDNEDFGKNKPPFQRYIPRCYSNRHKYIPSMYLMEMDEMPDQDTRASYPMKVIDGITYKLINGKWIPHCIFYESGAL